MIRATAVVIALLSLVTAEPTVVDLSVDFDTSLDNPGAQAIETAAASVPEIRTALVLEHGRIVAQYVREDVDPAVPHEIWSATKSWISLLVGLMVESSMISLDDTLADIWPPDDDAWVNVRDDGVRQNVTFRELLTMTSGLIDPVNGTDYLSLNYSDGGDAGGGSLENSLSYPDLGEKGIFSYLGLSNIISYVIQNKTGMSPREYASETVFPALGIEDATIDWWRNEDGMEYAYHGLLLTAHQMAKFGQLYLQEGLSAPGQPLVSSEWIAESSAPQVPASISVPGTNVTITFNYGYLFWVLEGALLGAPNAGSFYCALGLGGQGICVHPELDRVAVQQSDLSASLSGGFIAAVAFDPNLSFSPLMGGPPSAPPSISPSAAPSGATSGAWLRPMWKALFLGFFFLVTIL